MANEFPQHHPDTETVLLGLDLGRHHVRLALVTPQGEVRHFQREPYQFSPQNPDSARALADLLRTTSAQMLATHAPNAHLAAIGLALPGLIQHKAQRIVTLPLLPALAELDLRTEFQTQFNAPLLLINNAQAAAAAEMAKGCAQGVSDLLYFHLGSNVSAGLVLGGQLQFGNSGLAGAIGEMTIDPEQTGDHVELSSLVTTDNIVRRTRTRLQRDNTSSLSRLALPNASGGFTYQDILQAATQGDDLARLMLQRTGKFIGLAVCEIISLLNISLIAVGGDPGARDFLVPAIAAEAALHTTPLLFNECKIIAAALGAEATATGAALLAAKQQ